MVSGGSAVAYLVLVDHAAVLVVDGRLVKHRFVWHDAEVAQPPRCLRLKVRAVRSVGRVDIEGTGGTLKSECGET